MSTSIKHALALIAARNDMASALGKLEVRVANLDPDTRKAAEDLVLEAMVDGHPDAGRIMALADPQIPERRPRTPVAPPIQWPAAYSSVLDLTPPWSPDIVSDESMDRMIDEKSTLLEQTSVPITLSRDTRAAILDLMTEAEKHRPWQANLLGAFAATTDDENDAEGREVKLPVNDWRRLHDLLSISDPLRGLIKEKLDEWEEARALQDVLFSKDKITEAEREEMVRSIEEGTARLADIASRARARLTPREREVLDQRFQPTQPQPCAICLGPFRRGVRSFAAECGHRINVCTDCEQHLRDKGCGSMSMFIRDLAQAHITNCPKAPTNQ